MQHHTDYQEAGTWVEDGKREIAIGSHQCSVPVLQREDKAVPRRNAADTAQVVVDPSDPVVVAAHTALDPVE